MTCVCPAALIDYRTYSNFFAYGANGLKSDFGGHDNHHTRNIYAYTANCFGAPMPFRYFHGFNDEFTVRYAVRYCPGFFEITLCRTILASRLVLVMVLVHTRLTVTWMHHLTSQTIRYTRKVAMQQFVGSLGHSGLAPATQAVIRAHVYGAGRQINSL